MQTLRSWEQKGQYFKYNGHRIFYVEQGDGVPVLLLHGYPTASFDWTYIWDELLTGHKLLALDFLGFGFSDKPQNHQYNITEQADIVVSFLKERQITHFHLVAHNYAVSVAQELMSRIIYNEKPGYEILSVCLLNGGLIPELHRPVLIQKLLVSPLGPIIGKLFNKKRFSKSFGQVFAPDNVPSEEEMDNFWNLIQYNKGQAIIHKLLHYIADRKRNRNRWVNAIIDPPMPVKMINGLQDPVSGKHLVDAYRQLVKAPNIVALPQCGHYPQVESPAEVAAAIKSFLSENKNASN